MNAIQISPGTAGNTVQVAKCYVAVHARRFEIRRLERDRSEGQQWRDVGPVEWQGKAEVYRSPLRARNNTCW